MTRFRLLVFMVSCALFAGSQAGLSGCSSPTKSAREIQTTHAGIVGRPPPPIRVAKWVKGQPLASFEKGKVYIIDFWATWCGPCKAAIPHLTRMQQEHAGKLEVIGVSISERQKDDRDTSYIEGVERFVEKMDDRMDYRVAVDTPDKQMHATWFKPARTAGIPTAYIIDQRGNVAWLGIGDPKDLERIVNLVLAGTFDPAKEEAARVQAEKEAEERSKQDIAASKARGGKVDNRYPGYREAMDRGDQAAALASLNAAFKADPASETSGAYQWKLMLLLQGKDTKAVDAYAADLLNRYGDNDDIVGFVSAVTVSTSDEVRFDPKIAFDAAKKTADRAKRDSRWQQFARWRLAWASYHTGDRDQAKAQAQLALDTVRRLKPSIDFDGLEDECVEALRAFAAPRK